MAGAPPMTASASLVANAFVNKYYNVLHQSPHVVHRFYTDQSKLSRAEAGPNGVVDFAVSQVGIDKKIMSLDYRDFRAEIKTVDSQESLNGSVLVTVTGSLSSQTMPKRSFFQTFFLAPQEIGYFVLNDMFRYMDGETQSVQPPASMLIGMPDPIATLEVPEQVIDAQAQPQQEVWDYSNSALEEGTSAEDRYQPSEEEEVPEIEETTAEEVTASLPESSEVPVTTSEERLSSESEDANPEEALKKSYASILRANSDSSSASPQTVVRKAATARVDRSSSSSQVPQAAPLPVGLNPVADETTAAEGDARSVYVKNLPLSITSSELEEEFKRFGRLKSGGVNLRNQRQGVCFAFIEFEESTSAQSAIEGSPISMGGRKVYVEEKKPIPAALGAGRGQLNQGRDSQGNGNHGKFFYEGRGSARGNGQDSERDFNNRGRGTGTGRYGDRNNAPNNYRSGFNSVNGYRRTDNQSGNGARPIRRGAGNQTGPDFISSAA